MLRILQRISARGSMCAWVVCVRGLVNKYKIKLIGIMMRANIEPRAQITLISINEV